jgi:hypothetical protein
MACLWFPTRNLRDFCLFHVSPSFKKCPLATHLACRDTDIFRQPVKTLRFNIGFALLLEIFNFICMIFIYCMCLLFSYIICFFYFYIFMCLLFLYIVCFFYFYILYVFYFYILYVFYFHILYVSSIFIYLCVFYFHILYVSSIFIYLCLLFLYIVCFFYFYIFHVSSIFIYCMCLLFLYVYHFGYLCLYSYCYRSFGCWLRALINKYWIALIIVGPGLLNIAGDYYRISIPVRATFYSSPFSYGFWGPPSHPCKRNRVQSPPPPEG